MTRRSGAMRPGSMRVSPTVAAGIGRRALLGAVAGGAGALVLAAMQRRAAALGPADKFTIAQLAYTGGRWQPDATALKRLLWEVDKRTSIDVHLEPATVRLTDGDLGRYPFLYLAGDRAFPAPADDEVAHLRRHLQVGGFLVVDSAVASGASSTGAGTGGFDASVRQLCERLFPREPLARLPAEHVVYKSFYLVDNPVGRVASVSFLEGIEHDGRAVLVYSQNDLGGAWARDAYGEWEHEVVPGGDEQRERAFRLGINLAMYATCLDYKTDQVHVPFILRRRHWKSSP